jgi:hypothetical protein
MLDKKIIEDIKKVLADSVEGAVHNVQPSQSIEKAIKPEVSKETLLEVIKELQEIIVGMVEIEEEDSEEEIEDSEVEVEDANPAPIGDPEKNDVNWPVSKMEGQTDLEAETENGTYESDNEEEDKWNNIKKACWEGYTQRGMKDKNGKQVPNCVPVQKAEDLSEADQVVGKSLWGSKFDPTVVIKNK